MTSRWSLLSLLLFILFNIIQTSPVIVSDGNDPDSIDQLITTIDGNDNNIFGNDDANLSYQQKDTTHLIKNIMQETNPILQNLLLNQLREELNHMCVEGHFGPMITESCKRILNHLNQQPPLIRNKQQHNYQNKQQHNSDDVYSTDNTRQLKKRFFCNGFIGCKSGR
ncbi:unnamed protein product [Didymodactylos carnosus]|uniref:Uncharacterized protein n=1 Tax=Didymodactylos carnosus TaxID=1234261 RepID=A0A813PVG8_9BILA|nr:unnamed protein product [Didymodactylos carnosus]CAF0814045.1 unnamed protein product [Didymodactylos carnosus]CAF3537009.1 unnamed protein product [Didymodactylos carnosus]CAF3597934.1 unnamed protein product [Didymodactylos carnosus]